MKVQVERVLYDSPDTGFHICKAAVLEATQEDMIPKPLLGSLETLTIKGYFPVNKIVNLLVKGSWEKSKYGYALVVNEFKEIIPPTKDGIIAYLSATVYGIKESMAKKIVGQFGLQTLEVFENSPEQLLTVKGIGRQRLQKIIDSYKDSRSIQEIVSYLAPLGVTANKCAKIAKAFGGEAMNVLLNEPFRLCEIEGFGFLIVDQIARKTTFSLTDPMRICGAIRYVLQAAATEGHLCYRQLECICYAYLLLNDVDYKCAHIVKAVNEFIDTNNPLCLRQYVPDAKVPMTLVIEHFKTMALGYELKGDNGFVYLPFEYEQEVDIADIIAKRLTQNRQQTISDEEIAKAIREKEQDLKIQLAEKQKEAVALGVKENTCIITGGPGVGKTTVLKVVLSVCLQFGKLKSSDVTLLAPTGRAAQRMAESVGGDYTASTIHSALKIGGDDMRTFEPLDSKIVVVDEASMVDSHICWLLLKAVPDDAKLILIGDPEQLPSVGAGNVLFEFLNCQRIPTVRLDVIYRQAGTNSIVTNAGLIQQGVTKLTYDDDFRFFDVHATEDFPASDKERGKKIQSEARDIVIEQFMSAVKSEGLDEVQVLCPFRKKGVIAGATELNKEIQQRLNPPSYGKPEIKRGDRIFRLGDKVIQTKNNRDIGIFNGDVGYIKRIDTAEDEFIKIYNKYIHRKGAKELLQWLESTDFFTAPASTKYHGAYEGGLCEHLLNVFHFYYQEILNRASEFSGIKCLDTDTEETVAICALLHDVCKVNLYVRNTRNVKNEATGQWEKVPYYSVEENKFPYGHGEASVWLIQRFMRLNVEESLAIRWHMGGFDDAAKGYNLSAAYRQYPNAMLLHIADMKATYLLDK